MAALTALTLYNRIRSLLGDNPWYDTCAEAMDTTETGLDVADGTKYSVGTIVEFQDDGEQCLVTVVTSNTLTVLRNFNYSVGTTAGTGTSHSINAMIVANPTFKYVDITRALQGIVSTLWPYVWRVPTTTDTDGPVLSITVTAGTKWYSLGSAYLSNFEIGLIQQVRTVSPAHIITYGDNGGYPAFLRHGLASDVSTQFAGLYFPAIHNYDYPIKVNLISPIELTQTVAGTYDYLDDNTPATECLMYLAASRLVETTEIVRTTQSDVSMGDASVQPGTRLRLSAYLNQQGTAARNQWSMHCQAVWPRLRKSRFFKSDQDTGGRF